MVIHTDNGSYRPQSGGTAFELSPPIEFNAEAPVPEVFNADLPDAFVFSEADIPEAFKLDTTELPDTFKSEEETFFNKKQIKQLKDGTSFDKILDGYAYDAELGRFKTSFTEGLAEGEKIDSIYEVAGKYKDSEFLSEIEYDANQYYNPTGQGFRTEHLAIQELRFGILRSLHSSVEGKTHEERVGRFLLNIDLEKKVLSKNGGIRRKEDGAIHKSLQEQELFQILGKLNISKSDYRKVLVNNPEKFKAVMKELNNRMAAIKTYTAKGLTSRNKVKGETSSGVSRYVTGKNRHKTFAWGVVAAGGVNAFKVRHAKHFRARYLDIFKSQHLKMLKSEASAARAAFNASRSSIMLKNASQISKLKKLKTALSAAKKAKDAGKVASLSSEIGMLTKTLRSAFGNAYKVNKGVSQFKAYQRLIAGVKNAKTLEQVNALRSLKNIATSGSLLKRCSQTGKLVAAGSEYFALGAQAGRLSRAGSWLTSGFRMFSFGRATAGATVASAAGATAVGAGATVASVTGAIIPIAASFVAWELVTGVIEGMATDWKSDSYNVKALKAVGGFFSSMFSYE